MRRPLLSAVVLSFCAACSSGSDDTGSVGDGGGGDNSSGSTDASTLPQCETRTLSASQATPNMLIVLDRSTSMTDNDDNTDRWSGSVNAVTTVVEELEDQIRFGLMTFPNAGGFDQCAAGELDVPIQSLAAEPIADTLDGMRNRGYTPTAQTLQEARQVIADEAADVVGEFPLTQYVMLVTDGDPNCFSDQLTGDTEAQQASIQAVQELASDGVATYVIGFQTAGSDFAGVLDQMAAAGATGATQHSSVESGDALLEEFRRIAGGAVSCSFVLTAPADERRVSITVNGQPAEYGEDWDLRDDGQTVDLLGATCDALQSGAATVEANVSCDIVNVI